MSGHWRGVLLRDPCVYCYGESLGLDHIVPKSQGGRDGWTNRAPACRNCDSARGSHTSPLLFVLYRQFQPGSKGQSLPKPLVKARNRAIHSSGRGPYPILFRAYRQLELSPLVSLMEQAA